MTDTQTATDQPRARHTAAGGGEAWWFFDSLMVIRADEPGQPIIIEATVAPGGGAPLHVHADDSFLRFVREAGRPADRRTLPPTGPSTGPQADLDAAFGAAARTGQPVIGPPMGEEEAGLIAGSA
jgi:hypothetical protein